MTNQEIIPVCNAEKLGMSENHLRIVNGKWTHVTIGQGGIYVDGKLQCKNPTVMTRYLYELWVHDSVKPFLQDND